MLLGGGIARNQYGDHLAIRNWFSTPEFVQPSPTALELLTKASGSHGNRSKNRVKATAATRRTRGLLEDPEKWLFLDTETTGLAGGTGTYAFLVGLAWWDAGGLQVEQLFLRDLHEEYSLLQELAQRIADRPVLVTFNGKTFDWPLLENRFTMTRAIRSAATGGASGFASSGAFVVEIAIGIGATSGTGATRVGRGAAGLEARG